MKQIYYFFLVCLSFVLFSQESWGQTFSHKSDLSVSRIRSTSLYNKTVKFANMFNFPDGWTGLEQITDSSSVEIVFTSTNSANLDFYNYYWSRYSGQYFYYQIPAGAYGTDTLTVSITYNGVTAESQFIAEIIQIQCVDETLEVAMGETIEQNVLSNDKPSAFIDKTTFEVIQNVSYGIINIVEPGIIQYTSNSNTPNYTTDLLKYRVSDDLGAYDTALVTFNIHSNSYATKVYDFLPAPGQFVNTSGWGDTSSVSNVIGTTGGGVSLGGYGGYIIVGFDQPIVDRDENPYGVDFTVCGNAFGAWGGGAWVEPGAAQVSYDANKNGLPDDEWYELAGANYYLESTDKNLTMTYYNPKYNGRKTIPYRTNKGYSGAMRTNGFHAQSYYPDPYRFDVSPDSISYTGNKIDFLLDKSNPGYVRAMRWPTFGYCDNHPNNSDPTNPTNPYFDDENGNASDGFDLKWAVDMEGNRVNIDTVHFVKVYNPSQEDGGWLGEVSTEVTKFAITTPDPDYVPQNYEFNYIASSQIQVLKGTTLQHNGVLFKNGIPQEGNPVWISDSTHVATVALA